MLSEKQDTLTTFNWLAHWKKFARKSQQSPVCDFSMALLGAMSMAFCKIKKIINTNGYVGKI